MGLVPAHVERITTTRPRRLHTLFTSWINVLYYKLMILRRLRVSMSLRQQEPGFGQLSPIESVDDYCFGNRRISHDENNDFNGKMGVDDFRSECGDDDVTATNVNQMEMHRLPFFSVDQILERQDSLARVATLQECDRNRDPNGILDFLETTMNIEDYLDDIHAAAEIPLDSIDHEDIALQKCKTACQGDQLSKYHANDSFSSQFSL
ncbi:hypothetical protein KIN20_006422 [Parelaphostrongylus tenuis]|uniref:Uncharacterized protein n=1 Tax=Parelaphostrongylus tenuis TaxID=148309 RepID=A0AAD5M1R4_PARTN|nr:hypothetical protein KIN20_006422 [Parelaphostrongylus tenuis]